MILYDKNGKAFKIPHQIDVDEWMATGNYSIEEPKEKRTRNKKEVELDLEVYVENKNE